MINRGMVARISRLELAHSPTDKPVTFTTIYEDRDGRPEQVTTWWLDPERSYCSRQENASEYV